jgi:RNA-directed DNA polymerase
MDGKGTSRSQQVMDTVAIPMDEWKTLPWKDMEKRVFKLQKRIYQASSRGDVRTVHKLQRLLVNSWSAKCLAVRRVTQDNKGKRTAGIDGKTALRQSERIELVKTLDLKLKGKPLRRVWIPKPGSEEKRPLGIPTIADRAIQALVTMALEPEWEAKFEPNSYGFRPGRSCHDAIEAIFVAIHYTPKYVLDADIAKCFDNINHQALLNKLGTFPTLQRVIKNWLKAGVMDGDTLFATEAGTPQGGVISPLLANIALHGFEQAIREAFPERIRINGKKVSHWKPTVIRYADDFVILHKDRGVIEEARRVAAEWLHGMGLELKPSKTRITHTLKETDGNVGFDFLGFNIRQFRTGISQKRTSGKSGILLDFKTIIRPSKEAVKRHYREVATVIGTHNASTQEALIGNLNRIIYGWCNYYSSVVSKKTFSKLDHLVTKRLLRWAKRRHQKKSRRRTVAKYWSVGCDRRWDFVSPTGVKLKTYADTPIRRHIKVKGTRSPYDGDWVYWTTRMGRHPETPVRVAKLMKIQKGKCLWCGLTFKYGDAIEVDHIIPRNKGGKDLYKNLQLLHKHCHDQKGATDKDHVSEEPCECESLMHGFEDKPIGRPSGLV